MNRTALTQHADDDARRVKRGGKAAHAHTSLPSWKEGRERKKERKNRSSRYPRFHAEVLATVSIYLSEVCPGLPGAGRARFAAPGAKGGISAGGPYEVGVVLRTRSAGFLGAVFDGI